MKPQREKIYEAEWDCLIILDATRYDVFCATNWLDGELEKVYSAGSCTDEWFLNTFTSPLRDTVLVSPHPFFSPRVNPKHLPLFDVFDDIVYVTRSEPADEKGIYMGLCPAEHTTDVALATNAKRMMVHYCQPHFPALGEPELKLGNNKVYPKVRSGELSLDFVKQAYTGNLVYVLREAERLIKATQRGRIVITADHGELLGEGNLFGHPPNQEHPVLREVPCLTITKPRG